MNCFHSINDPQTVQERLEELQSSKDSKKSESLLNEGVAKLINLVYNQHSDEDALFEESFNNREHIKNLPMEEACWTIGEIELCKLLSCFVF